MARYTYDAGGNILSQEGIFACENPYRYASYRYDAETKFYYLMARYYNPQKGNFISLDPYPGDLEDLHSQNRYSYVSNNPVMKVDPSGCWLLPVFSLAWAVYDGVKAYREGKGAGGVAFGLIGGGRIKLAGKL